MRVALGPYMQPPQASPPPPSPSKSNNMPILYYALVAVGTAAIVLAIYNFIFIKWGTDNHRRQPWQVMAPAQRVEQGASSQCCSRSFDDPNMNLISSFKYKKEGGGAAASRDQMNEYECAVCLSVFEEGEDVRQLPRCKHSFHTSCIDMWLYSHLDCPLCRSPVEPPVLNRLACPTRPARDSRGGLIDPRIFVL